MSLPQSLIDARAWAKERLRKPEPPWSFYRFMQIIDAVDAIEKGMESTVTTARELEPTEHSSDGVPQRGAKVFQLETSPRPSDKIEVPLPM